MSKVVVALTPLHRAPFRRLWLGQSISLLGDQFTTIALLRFVLQLTGSGAAVGLVILCFQLPCVVTGPLLDRLLDRVQPRVLMGIDNLVRALLIGAIPSLSLLKVLSLWYIYALALLVGALSPTTQAGVRVVLPYLVADHKLEQANALSSASEQFAYLIGPVLAGVVVSKVGGPWALLLDASSFLLMGLLVLSLSTVLPTVGQERAAVSGQWFGFGLLWRMKEVRLLTALSLVFFFSYGPLEAALPLYSPWGAQRDKLKEREMSQAILARVMQ
jgi:MFS family permease